MRSPRWLLTAVLALVLAAFPALGATAEEHRPAPGSVRPNVTDRLHASPVNPHSRLLDRVRHGRAALAALDGKLGTAARRSGLTMAQLSSTLKHDPTAWISTTGRLFYADADSQSTPPIGAEIGPPPLPLGNTFLLHSKPGSAHTIYLDFNGYNLPSWAGWISNGWTAGTVKGFSIDADYTTFSDTEKAYIQYVWQIVAEKYSSFDVDVTTQDPGSDAINRNGIGDPTFGSRVVFTDDPKAKPAAVCPPGCYGIAFIGTFDDPADNDDEDEPAWIYTSEMHDVPSYAANVAAHEVGHNLGLLHDGTNTAGAGSYFEGHGNWFPIMGAGINAVGQFSKGEYADANETQDDLAVIASHGATERGDDWGDDGTPSDLGQQSTYAVDGVIEDSSDTDVFKITRSCVADLHAEVSGIGEGQAVDLKLTVKDASDTPIQSDDPPSGQNTTAYPYRPTGMDAEVTVASAPAASYLIQVEGVGHGDPVTDGYSKYGSIGQYHLTVSGCSGTDGQVASAPTNVTSAEIPRTGRATLTWGAPASPGSSAVTGYRITGLPSGTHDVPASQTSYDVTNLEPDVQYDVKVAALNTYGAGPSAPVVVSVNSWAPNSAPPIRTSVSGTTVTIDWSRFTNPGYAQLQDWRVDVYGSNGRFLQAFDSAPQYSGMRITGIPNGVFTFKVYLYSSSYYGPNVSPKASARLTFGPSAPRIGRASSGSAGRPVTATVRWLAPSILRGSRITGYQVGAYKLNSSGHIVRVLASSVRPASSRSFVMRLPAGRYKFRVIARSAGGWSALSSYSRIVTAR